MEKIKQKIVFYYNSTLNFIADTLSQSSSKEGFIRYFKNTGWLFVSRISGMIASFFVGIYIARYLGPSQYGLLNYVISFTGIFSVFCSFGIDSILNRELVLNPEKKETLLGSGFFIKLIGSIISIILIFITIIFIKPDKITFILILISASSFIFNAFGVIDSYFQSQVLSKNTVKIQLLSLIIMSFLKILFIIFKLGLIYFILAYTIEVFIVAIGLVFVYKKMGFKFSKWKIDKNIIKYLLKNSWPLMFSGVAVSIYMKIDQVMITNMINSEANGFYSIAVKLSEIWYFIPAIICTSLLPAIINAKNTNNLIYKKRLKSLFKLMFIISLLTAIIITIFSPLIINILFGNEYLRSINVLRIHIWAGIGVFLGYAMYQFLIVENMTKIFLITTILGAIINVILNLILIPKLNINGAAISTFIAYTFQTLSVLFFKKVRKKLF